MKDKTTGTLAFLAGVALAVVFILMNLYQFAPAKDDTPTAGRSVPAIPATEPFDHSVCQYPDRTTNPPRGCDNTDPCDAATTKGGTGDCLPQSDTVEPPKCAIYEGRP